ncbi:MAG: ABC transporter ATP-binding protein [Sphaerobacteraceae bacterium]|nr:MAG: ABC transporter ATP-binding protein [Sphaerobacteraceae bacterium]
MLNVQNVSKMYGQLAAVQDVSLSVRRGEIVGLLGPNGAGKSTLIKCIAGLLRASDGAISVDGFLVRTPEARGSTGYIPEVPSLYDLLTPWEHLQFIALAYGLQNWEDHATELLGQFGLSDKRDAFSGELSKGMRQKVLIACALLHQPSLYLFDEPTVGLDPQAQRELTRQLLRLRDDGHALLVSTHILAQIEPIADRAIIMSHGRTIAGGTLAELRETFQLPADTPLEDVFLQVTE